MFATVGSVTIYFDLVVTSEYICNKMSGNGRFTTDIELDLEYSVLRADKTTDSSIAPSLQLRGQLSSQVRNPRQVHVPPG